MQTHNLAEDKFKKLQELFPNAVTEVMNENGEIEKAIDKDVLMQEISSKVVEGREERYQFTWPDKKQSILAANAPISKTLRPCRDESKNFDTTENLYIEGDNLEVLKLLQETYLGQIKMIYIDPPYNTGNDFVYNDDFKQTTDEYLEDSGQFDEEGNRLDKNLESNGRFHTDWLNMIYPRLKLARNLLSDDGVIFISIDDNEQANLKKVCDEVFGPQNFVANICHKNRNGVSNDKIISNNHNILLFYCKDQRVIHENRHEFGILRTKDDFKNYNKNDNDGNGNYTLNPVTGPGGARKGNPYYEFLGIKNYWRFSKERMSSMYESGRIIKLNNSLYQKTYVKDLLNKKKGATTWWDYAGTTSQGTQTLKLLFGKTYFDFSKPVNLIINILNYIKDINDGIVLDFFSGSATTAHAVMQLNAEDGGNRKFIMVQLPEQTDEKSEAYKAGYKNICEIGKERIRRAGEKILEENKDKENIDKLDVGFRVLKTDSSNMKDVYYSPENTEQSFLDNLEDNIKEDRTQEDLLFQVMLDLGVPLSSTIEVEQIEDAKVFKVEDRFLVACFDGAISDEVVKQIADMKPFYAVFRDMSMKNDSVAVNFEQIFESVSPETIRKVL